jgi:hypothetical protein
MCMLPVYFKYFFALLSSSFAYLLCKVNLYYKTLKK